MIVSAIQTPRAHRFFAILVASLCLWAADSISGSWQATGKPPGWTVGGGHTNPYVNDIAVSGSNLLASAYNKIYRSRDSGATWTLLNTRFDTTSYKVNDLFVWQGMVYAATPRGIYRSLDSGTTWSKSGLGLQTRYISTLTSGQGTAFLSIKGY